MLEALREEMDALEREDENSHQFVERLLIEYEENGKAPTLSRKQYKWLNDLYERYCL